MYLIIFYVYLYISYVYVIYILCAFYANFRGIKAEVYSCLSAYYFKLVLSPISIFRHTVIVNPQTRVAPIPRYNCNS